MEIYYFNKILRSTQNQTNSCSETWTIQLFPLNSLNFWVSTDFWDINLNSSKTETRKTSKPETTSWWSWKLNLAFKSLFSFPSGQERKDHWFIALLLMAPNSFSCNIRKSLFLELGPNCKSMPEFALRNHTHVFSSVLPVQPLQTSLCYFWLTPALEDGKPVPVWQKWLWGDDMTRSLQNLACQEGGM